MATLWNFHVLVDTGSLAVRDTLRENQAAGEWGQEKSSSQTCPGQGESLLKRMLPFHWGFGFSRSKVGPQISRKSCRWELMQ